MVACTVAATTILATATLRPLLKAGLPPLVVAYCMVSVFLFAIFPHWTLSAMATMQWWPVPETAQQWLITYFRTLGALLFSPTLGIGIIIALAILLWSRLAFLAGTVGWIAGFSPRSSSISWAWCSTGCRRLTTSFWLARPRRHLSDSQPYQPAPGCARGRNRAAGGGLSTSIPYTAIGYLPLASALTIWVALSAVGVTENFLVRRNRTMHLPPETAWQRLDYWSRRSGTGPFLIVPLCGRSRITQGEDGLLSHVGPWRHALDFQPVSAVEPGTYDGMVMAPASGYIERIHDGVSDNPTGICNYADNWGTS